MLRRLARSAVRSAASSAARCGSVPLVPTGASERCERLRFPSACLALPLPAAANFPPCHRPLLTLPLLQANLASALSGPGPFTVFAPTNEAFVAALGALKLSKQQLLDLPTLSNILKFHVVSGKVMSSQLTNGMEVRAPEMDIAALLRVLTQAPYSLRGCRPPRWRAAR